MMRYTSPEVTLYDALIDIDVDADLSEAVDLVTDTLIGLVLPANYDTAAITFQVSVDGTTFVPLYDTDGQVSIANTEAVASRAISLDPVTFLGWRYVKIATAAAQTTTDTTITLVGRAI
jgi:hypothetical protein